MQISKIAKISNVTLLLLVGLVSAQGRMSLEEANRICRDNLRDERAIASSRAHDGSPNSCTVTTCYGGGDAYFDNWDQRAKCCPSGTRYHHDDRIDFGQCCAPGQTLSVNTAVRQGACCGSGHSFFWDSSSQRGICCPHDSEAYRNGECQPRRRQDQTPFYRHIFGQFGRDQYDRDQYSRDRDQYISRDYSRDRDQYSRDRDQYGRDRDQYGRDRDQYGRDRDQYGRDRDQYGRDRDQLRRDRDQYGRDRDQLGRDQYSRDQLNRDRDQYGRDRDQYSRDQWNRDRDQYSHDQLRRDRDQYNRDQLRQDRDQYSRGRDQWNRDRDQYGRDRDQYGRDRDQLNRERDQFGRDQFGREQFGREQFGRDRDQLNRDRDQYGRERDQYDRSRGQFERDQYNRDQWNRDRDQFDQDRDQYSHIHGREQLRHLRDQYRYGQDQFGQGQSQFRPFASHGQECRQRPKNFFPCDDCHGVEVCPNTISMGMQFGRCYQFTDPKRGTLGRYLNEYQMGGIMQGVHFKLCRSTNDCNIGEELQPGQTFFLQDMIGDVNDVTGKPAWMNAAANLAHKQVTTNAAAAAELAARPGCFADGCLLCMQGAGSLQGFGMACPSPQSGVSQFQNPNVCLPLKVTQVRCLDDKSHERSWIFHNRGVSVDEREPRMDL